MAQQYSEISGKLKRFIEDQKIFFVATATADSKINISPKGMDSLRVLDKRRVVWLNMTGSGNETSAHIQENPRMTIMFAAFEGDPMILRLYGAAKVIHKKSPEYLISFQIPRTRRRSTDMYYAIMATDRADSLNARLEARPAHLERLRQLQDAGRLLLAGPHPAIDSEDPGTAGFTGSLIVAEFPDLEAAQAWATEDPYVAAGVFMDITVKPWRKVFPE